jgi:poly-gamma-glutamate synthesis protein (capsule biosynthesis protein)
MIDPMTAGSATGFDELQLVAVGDLLIATGTAPYRDERVLELMRQSDVTFANLEVVFAERDASPAAETRGHWTGTEPEVAADLAELAIGLVASAHNHSYDYGAAGLRTTWDALRRNGIAHAGSGATLADAQAAGYVDTPGGRVALVASSASLQTEAPAGAQRSDVAGRPGVNPLRIRTEYVVEPGAFEHVRAVDAALRHDGFDLEQHRWRAGEALTRGADEPDAIELLGHRFVRGGQTGVRSAVEPRDLERHLRAIAEARRRADWVLVSLHTHDFDVAKDQPPQFMREYAHACIDAGADAFLGHGPHLLRGIEFHEGRPIFYSLGNFVFHLDLFSRQPADAYARVGLDPYGSLPGDLYTRRADGGAGFGSLGSDRRYWESIVASCRLRRDAPPEIRVHPIELGATRAASGRGVPQLAVGDQAREIVALLQGLSEPFGTRLEQDGDSALVFAS